MTATKTLPLVRLSPPKLHDRSQYVRVERVPLLDPHVRRMKRDGKIVHERVSADQLARIAANNRKREARGEYSLVFLGHTATEKDVPESEQPPLLGYAVNYHMARLPSGSPVIAADMYIKVRYKDVLEQFPRRSIEIFGKNDADGYIDAIALLKRSPERDLGLVTYARDGNRTREVYSCPDCSCEISRTSQGTPKGETMDNEALIESIADAVIERIADFVDEPEPVDPNEISQAEHDDGAIERFAKDHPELDRSNYIGVVSAYLEQRRAGYVHPEQYQRVLPRTGFDITQREVEDGAIEHFAKAHPELNRNDYVGVVSAYLAARQGGRVHVEQYQRTLGFEPGQDDTPVTVEALQAYQRSRPEIPLGDSSRLLTEFQKDGGQPRRRERFSADQLSDDEIMSPVNVLDEYSSMRPALQRCPRAELLRTYLKDTNYRTRFHKEHDDREMLRRRYR